MNSKKLEVVDITNRVCGTLDHAITELTSLRGALGCLDGFDSSSSQIRVDFYGDSVKLSYFRSKTESELAACEIRRLMNKKRKEERRAKLAEKELAEYERLKKKLGK